MLNELDGPVILPIGEMNRMRRQLAERDAISAEGIRVHVDLILLGHAADGANLCYARDRVDLRADVVFLQGPTTAGVEVACARES